MLLVIFVRIINLINYLTVYSLRMYPDRPTSFRLNWSPSSQVASRIVQLLKYREPVIRRSPLRLP